MKVVITWFLKKEKGHHGCNPLEGEKKTHNCHHECNPLEGEKKRA